MIKSLNTGHYENIEYKVGVRTKVDFDFNMYFICSIVYFILEKIYKYFRCINYNIMRIHHFSFIIGCDN